MSDNIEILLVGCGYMGKEYCKILLEMGKKFTVIGRGSESAERFYNDTKISVIEGGVDAALKKINSVPKTAIVATTVDTLSAVTITLIKSGVKRILVEKPAGINEKDVAEICDFANKYNVEVFVAYNRRFYSSTEKAIEIIEEDGGVTSFNFEFTEWAQTIEGISNPDIEKKNWLLVNSTHVIDLAFFLGGEPVEMCSYVKGSLPWHSNGAIYSGAGITDKGALFSYQANWSAPGRWSVEILTKKHRLYFKPMESLSIQELNSVTVNVVDIDNSLDIDYKPGIYKQINAFLKHENQELLLTIEDQSKHMQYYKKIAGLRSQKEK